MEDIPQWWMKGAWFDACSCDIPCPCGFAQPPTNGHCEGIMAYHIDEGAFGDLRLDGFNVIAVVVIDGDAWAQQGTVSMGIFLDESANKQQREALQAVFSGEAGGWMGMFSELVSEVRGMEFVPIKFEVSDDLARWQTEIPGKVKTFSEALTGPTTPEGERVQVHNAPGSEVGPGQIMTLGKAMTNEVDAFGLKWSWAGKASKHIPFDWSGPELAS